MVTHVRRSASSPVVPSVISDKNNLFFYRKLHLIGIDKDEPIYSSLQGL